MKKDYTTLAIFAAIAALLYFVFKKKTTTAPIGSLAATTSPHGSASGILTPVTQSTGLLSALDAFLEDGPGQTAQQTEATMSNQAINYETSTGPIISPNDYTPSSAPTITENTLDSSLFATDSNDINISSPDDSSISEYAAFES
jgi:hypothetical protein